MLFNGLTGIFFLAASAYTTDHYYHCVGKLPFTYIEMINLIHSSLSYFIL